MSDNIRKDFEEWYPLCDAQPDFRSVCWSAWLACHSHYVPKLEAIIGAQLTQLVANQQQLAATELVVEKMREALEVANDYMPIETPLVRNEFTQKDIATVTNALQLQPSLSALNEVKAKVLKDAQTRINNLIQMFPLFGATAQEVYGVVTQMISELRMASNLRSTGTQNT